jgi:hypothetical protein
MPASTAGWTGSEKARLALHAKWLKVSTLRLQVVKSGREQMATCKGQFPLTSEGNSTSIDKAIDDAIKLGQDTANAMCKRRDDCGKGNRCLAEAIGEILDIDVKKIITPGQPPLQGAQATPAITTYKITIKQEYECKCVAA